MAHLNYVPGLLMYITPTIGGQVSEVVVNKEFADSPATARLSSCTSI